MNLDVYYSAEEDRLRLSLRDHNNRTDCWLSRRILLAWINGWLRQLDAVNLPQVAGVDLPRDLGAEHRLSLEFDGPVSAPEVLHTIPPRSEWLRETLSLTVQATGSVLTLNGQGNQMSFELTRKESHAVLDMLAAKARVVGWLDTPQWPVWLGTSEPQPRRHPQRG